MKDIVYTIAGVTVRLRVADPVMPSERFMNFLQTDGAVPEIAYEVAFFRNDSVNMDKKEDSLDYVGTCFAVEKGEIEKRYFYPDHLHMEDCYAIGYYDLANRRIRIDYKQQGFGHMNETANSFYHIGWERILMQEGRMVLHACCMETSYGGLLFSGVSGIGKSTQGCLWEQYEQAVMINGDRPIIYRDKDEPDCWKAAGSPYAGSSNCYVNREVPIRAIVMLGQAKTCRIRKLNGAEAFRMIYAQLVVCDWSQTYMNRLLAELESLVAAVPVYYMECTPDQAAVALLKQTLEAG